MPTGGFRRLVRGPPMFSKFRPSPFRPNTAIPPVTGISNQELERWLREEVLGLDQDPESPESAPAPPAADEKPSHVPHRDAA